MHQKEIDELKKETNQFTLELIESKHEQEHQKHKLNMLEDIDDQI